MNSMSNLQEAQRMAMAGPGKMRLEDVVVEFTTRAATVRAVDHVSLDIAEGEFVALVGPSGCGKSTVLNMIAGLLKPSSGSVTYDGSSVTGPNTRVGYMTQKDTLLPWRTVEDNIGIAFELRNRRASASQRKERVRGMIELVGLSGFERHFPSELSGGMRKRAALARMLIYEPETLLLDEPFGALDAQLRLVMQQELLRLVDRRKMTVVLVTHDLEEAVALADRLVVFTSRPGKIRSTRAIDFARPRVPEQLRFTPEFGALCAELWHELREELDKSVGMKGDA